MKYSPVYLSILEILKQTKILVGSIQNINKKCVKCSLLVKWRLCYSLSIVKVRRKMTTPSKKMFIQNIKKQNLCPLMSINASVKVHHQVAERKIISNDV